MKARIPRGTLERATKITEMLECNRDRINKITALLEELIKTLNEFPEEDRDIALSATIDTLIRSVKLPVAAAYGSALMGLLRVFLERELIAQQLLAFDQMVLRGVKYGKDADSNT